jgi:hypothetical protein
MSTLGFAFFLSGLVAVVAIICYVAAYVYDECQKEL